jgi:hypothetical protein
MKAHFVNRLVLETADCRDDGCWLVLRALLYWSALLDRMITVPAGFKTDLASVPRWPLAYWICGGLANEAAVIHDYLYASHLVSRRQADAILREAAKATGVNWRRWLMWAAVRCFGWLYW